jgi:hypothetical protein
VTSLSTRIGKAPAVPTAKRGRPRRRQPADAPNRKRKRNDASTNGLDPERNDDVEEDPSVADDESSTEAGESKKLYPCPFAKPRDGARTLCKWAPHADKRSVRICYEIISLTINS